MRNTLSPNQSRFLAVLVLLVLLVVSYLALVDPVWVEYLDNQEQINTLQDRLDRFQGLADETDALTGSYQQLLQSSRNKGYLLKGDSFALAAAELQSLARITIEGAGGTLISTQPLKEGDTSDSGVKVRVKMQGDIKAIKETLQGIETGRLILLIDNVSIVKNRRRRSRTATGMETPLQLHFDLTGFVSEREHG